MIKCPYLIIADTAVQIQYNAC